MDLADKPDFFKDKYAELSPVPTARAKVPILEVGAPGDENYFAIIESEVVARFVAKRWDQRGTALIPSSSTDEAAMNLFISVFMAELSGLSFSFLGAKSDENFFVILLRPGLPFSEGGWVRGERAPEGPIQQYLEGRLLEFLTNFPFFPG